MEKLLAELADIPLTIDPALVKQKSRDFFWYSPVLNRQLRHCTAQAVITPRDEADVVRVAAACVRHRVPITARGGGTGNYGQAVPLHRDIRPKGWELRMHPSTKRSGTIGGFVAGGSGGVGSVIWGGLREPGNVAAARIVTMEAEPRIIELREAEAQAVNHAYGTTGLITALEMPLAPAWHWIDIIVAFPKFMDAVRFGYAIALADGIVKKLLSPIAWPAPDSFRQIREHCPDGHAILIAMVADQSAPAFKSVLSRRHATGTITFEQPTADAPGEVPLYEFTWNHTTLQMLKRDRGVTYLQTMHPAATLLDSVAAMETLFGVELIPHLEFLRVGGQVTASGLPIVRFTTEDRLNAVISEHRALGISIADPHVFTLEDGAGHKQVDADQFGFKRHADPLGLLNPGKMRTYAHAAM
jgi:FAD/FMN-containing dehydrogenase